MDYRCHLDDCEPDPDCCGEGDGCCRDDREFPVLRDCRTQCYPACPASIPWHLIEPFEPIVVRDYHQCLESIAARGGFTPIELYKIFRREWLANVCCPNPVTPGEAVAFLLGLHSGHDLS